MTLRSEHGRPEGYLAHLTTSSGEFDWASFSVLATLLDAHLLLGEPALAVEELAPLFQVWWPDGSLCETVALLAKSGLVAEGSGLVYLVPPGQRRALAGALDAYLASQPVNLPAEDVPFGDLLVGFDKYCQEQMSAPKLAGPMLAAWGGATWSSAGHTHLLLLRPFPLRLKAHPELYTLMVCQLPDNNTAAVTDLFVQRPSLRQRLALYDLDLAEKMNLTRSDLFVHFERYLRWVHGLRIVPSPALTRSLLDSGLLVLEKA